MQQFHPSHATATLLAFCSFRVLLRMRPGLPLPFVGFRPLQGSSALTDDPAVCTVVPPLLDFFPSDADSHCGNVDHPRLSFPFGLRSNVTDYR